MKKLYLLMGAGVIMANASAQTRSVSTTKRMSTVGLHTSSNSRTVDDTLKGNWEFVGTPSLSYADLGGYVIGNNGYGDLQKAQAFMNTSPLKIEGALIWFGAKERDLAGSSTSKVQVQVHAMDGTGHNVSDSTADAPGTVLSTTDLLWTDIDTSSLLDSGLNAVTFPSPIFMTGDFAIGVNLQTLAAGDTVGIIHSDDGEGFGMDLSWEQWSNGTWNSIAYAWELDLDIFIWVTVDMSAVNVDENSFINGAKLYQNQPNPANGSTNIIYQLEKATDHVSVRIFDASGKTVAIFNEGNKPAGKHTINFSTANLEAGIYYYALTAGDGRIAQKMIVE